MGCKAKYFQGEQYSLVFVIEQNGERISLENVELIEFTVGTISKSWPQNVKYVGEEMVFLFPVTQEEMFGMDEYVQYQTRVKFKNGDVYASPINKIYVEDTISKNIL